MPEPSTIFFPLRSNASALIAGSSVAAVRRRILVAGLLHDHVILEDGLYMSWAGATGASDVHGRVGTRTPRWQTTRDRHRLTGATHYVAMSPSGAPAGTRARVVVRSPAEFSWRATFEPFKRELPASASSWLDFGHPTDETAIKQVVRDWLASDRRAKLTAHLARAYPHATSSFARDAILKSGYFDLALSAVMGVGISIDRRHELAIAERIAGTRGQRIGGHGALEVLLPTGLSWDDLPDLRTMRAIREYRAVIRDIEAAAIDTASSTADLRGRIEREYAIALAKATARGIPFRGRLVLATIGFVVGAAADTAAPLVGSAAVGAATFTAGELASRAMRPRWLSVDRSINRHRNGV